MFGTLIQSLIWLVYQPSCIHCQEVLADRQRLVCDPCGELMDLLDPAARCSHCFGLIGEEGCGSCLTKPAPWHGVAAALEYTGPAASLIRAMKYHNRPYLAKPAAAFLAAQWSRLNWPLPDILVPVPMPWLRQMARGYNQAELLALELGTYFQRPVVKAVKRSGSAYSQAGLSIKQRQQLSSSQFTLCDPSVYGRNILLIDDVMTTGSTLQACAECLLTGEPARLYSLTVCRTPG